MDTNIRKLTLKLLSKILNTKRTNFIKFIYSANINLIECGYEFKYYSKATKKYLVKGIK